MRELWIEKKRDAIQAYILDILLGVNHWDAIQHNVIHLSEFINFMSSQRPCYSNFEDVVCSVVKQGFPCQPLFLLCVICSTILLQTVHIT